MSRSVLPCSDLLLLSEEISPGKTGGEIELAAEHLVLDRTSLTHHQIGWSHLGVLITSFNSSWSHLEKHLLKMLILGVNFEGPDSGEQELRLSLDSIWCESRETPAFHRS